MALPFYQSPYANLPSEPLPLPGLDILDDIIVVPQGPAKKRRRRVTEDTVKAKCDNVVQFWQSRDNRMDEDYLLYRLTKPSTKAPGEIVLHNMPYVSVERAANMLGKQTPKIDVVAEEGVNREEAQRVENLIRYTWEVWDDEWSSTLHNSLSRDVAHFLALRGWATLRINYDIDAEVEEVPVRLSPYDPRQVYPMIGKRGLSYVVHRYWTTIGELVSEWPRAKRVLNSYHGALTPVNDDELVEVTGYYDDFYHAVYIDAGFVKPLTPHDYGFVPWIIGIGAGGPERTTSTGTLEYTRYIGVSMFEGAKEAYSRVSKIMSQLATEVAKKVAPPVLYYHDPSNPEAPKPLKFNAGATNYLLYNREKVEPLDLTPNPSAAGPLLEILRENMEMATLPASAWGIRSEGSGYTQTLLAETVEAQMWAIVVAMQRIYREASQYYLRLIRDFHDGPVSYLVRDTNTGEWRSGMRVSPETIALVGTRVKVTFRNITPRDIASMSQLAIALTDKKVISLETAREDFVGLDNPQREAERVMNDLVNLDDEYIKARIEETLKRDEPELYNTYMKAKERAKAEASPPAQQPQLPGMAPTVSPPIAQTPNPLDLLMQSLGSAQGGASAGPITLPGIPGIGGSLPQIPQAQLPLPGLV